MALSDNPNEKDRKRPQRAVLAETNKRWSDKQKLEAVQSWLVLGNMSMVSRLHGIPRITLQVWKTSTWWKELVDELKLQEKIELSSKMKAIVDAAHQVVANRLEHGDPVLNQKTGEIVMKPVPMRDAHRVAVDLLNQREVLEKVNRQPDVVEDGTKLEALAERFAEFATKSIEKRLDKKRTIDVNVVDVEDKSAVYDQREEGLQEGKSLVQLEAGTNQEADGEDDSPPSS